ncbi:MAG: AbrB/MazE/SpoVT family DNA-binding domain-containing protein [Oscillospiraceae bacterium]|nr:AbrB/MazE/SpoVT family DNA-binding domain-containing protein [Oscillospiraceae bacterium]
MKSTVDELGRILLPKAIRNQLGVKEKDEVKIIVYDNKIVIEKVKD